MTLLRALESINGGKSVERATRQFGVKRQFFYFWLRRLIAADFAIEGLREKSKRPHRSPNDTSEEIIRRAEEIRRIEGSGGHSVARNGMSIQEFQRLTDDFLHWYNKRRPHWSLDGLTPHERFFGCRLAQCASPEMGTVILLAGLL